MTSKQMIWESSDSDKVYRQTTVVAASGDYIGKPYYFRELVKGDVGITLQVDLGKALPEGLSNQQRMTLHSLLLKMAFNVLTHKRLMIGPASETASALQQPQFEPAIIESGRHLILAGIESGDERFVVQLMMERGELVEEELADADKQSKQLGITILEALERLKYVSQSQIVSAQAEHAGVLFVDLDEMEIDPEVIASVPKNVIIEHQLIPVHRKKKVLVVATDDQMDFFELDNLKFILNCEVEYALTTKSALDKAIAKYYGEGPSRSIDEVAGSLNFDEVDDLLSAVDSIAEETDEILAYDKSVMKITNLILLHGIKANAKKLIISVEKDACAVRAEIAGKMYNFESPTAKSGPAIMNRLRVMARVDIAESSSPQMGTIDLAVGGRAVDIAVHFIPLANGEIATLDISYPESRKKNGGPTGEKKDEEEGEGPAPIGAKP